MELIRGLHNLRPRHRGCVATIGAFDGVHLGHQAVIRHLLDKAQELALPSVVIVFEPLPREYFSPLQAPARIMSFREKCRALEQLGVDRVLRIRFNERLREMSAQQFVDDIFVAGLGVRYVVLGDDFRFGNDRQGDVNLSRSRGGATVMTLAPRLLCRWTVSASAVPGSARPWKVRILRRPSACWAGLTVSPAR